MKKNTVRKVSVRIYNLKIVPTASEVFLHFYLVAVANLSPVTKPKNVLPPLPNQSFAKRSKALCTSASSVAGLSQPPPKMKVKLCSGWEFCQKTSQVLKNQEGVENQNIPPSSPKEGVAKCCSDSQV